MGLGNYAKGWDGVEEDDDFDNDSGGGISENDRLYRFRFEISPPNGNKKSRNLVVPGRPVTKRILFLDGSPYKVKEHNLYGMPGSKGYGAYTAICLKTDPAWGKDCPLCDKSGGDKYPYTIGFFPIIDLGQVEYRGGTVRLHHDYWEDKRGVKHYRVFQKVLLGAKKGSRLKPGVLQKLFYEMQDLREQKGIQDLYGTVWDVTRSGEKAAVVGDSWRFVDVLEGDQFDNYIRNFEAKDEDGRDLEYVLDLDVPLLDVNNIESSIYVDPECQYSGLSKVVGWGEQCEEKTESFVRGAKFDEKNNNCVEDCRCGAQIDDEIIF